MRYGLIRTYLLFGESDQKEHLLSFLCEASNASLSFAQRLFFFLSSLVHKESLETEKIALLLEFIQAIYSSKDSSTMQELQSFYIPNSENYLEKIKNSRFISKVSSEVTEKAKAIKARIEVFCDEQLLTAKENLKRKSEGKPPVSMLAPRQISKDDFLLSIYNRESGKAYEIEMIETEDANLNSFFSNLNLMADLCAVGSEIMKLTGEQQFLLLQEEITKINKKLPSNVFIPFISKSIRNYTIVHIPVSELKIFKTKERAPYMITVEAIRIEEITR